MDNCAPHCAFILCRGRSSQQPNRLSGPAEPKTNGRRLASRLCNKRLFIAGSRQTTVHNKNQSEKRMPLSLHLPMAMAIHCSTACQRASNYAIHLPIALKQPDTMHARCCHGLPRKQPANNVQETNDGRVWPSVRPTVAALI